MLSYSETNPTISPVINNRQLANIESGETCGNQTCSKYQECKADICQCYKCLKSKDNTCEVPDCYKFDNVNKECKPAGKKYVTALLLQGFLGTFGGGLWYIENYLWAGCQLGLILLLCFSSCCAVSDKEACEICGKLLKIAITVAIAGFWITSMVYIAEHKFTGPDDCPLVD